MPEIEKIAPVVLYDNACHLCIRFARSVRFLSRDKILLVGHFSDKGKSIRDDVLDGSATEMFWFIDGKNAYGGRAAVIPLLRCMLYARGEARVQERIGGSCGAGCKSPQAVLVRSASLLTHSRKIRIRAQNT